MSRHGTSEVAADRYRGATALERVDAVRAADRRAAVPSESRTPTQACAVFGSDPAALSLVHHVARSAGLPIVPSEAQGPSHVLWMTAGIADAPSDWLSGLWARRPERGVVGPQVAVADGVAAGLLPGAGREGRVGLQWSHGSVGASALVLPGPLLLMTADVAEAARATCLGLSGVEEAFAICLMAARRADPVVSVPLVPAPPAPFLPDCLSATFTRRWQTFLEAHLVVEGSSDDGR